MKSKLTSAAFGPPVFRRESNLLAGTTLVSKTLTSRASQPRFQKTRLSANLNGSISLEPLSARAHEIGLGSIGTERLPRSKTRAYLRAMREAELAAFKSASPVLEEQEDAEPAPALWGETVRAAGGHRRETVLMLLMALMSASAVVWTAAGSFQLVERWANFVDLVKSLVG